MSNDINNPIEIDETDLDEAQGGLLLPAVQKVREAAANSQAPGDARPLESLSVNFTKISY